MKRKKNKTVAKVPVLESMSDEWYKSATPKQLIDHIDNTFKTCIVYLKKTGRIRANMREVLVRYGIWSRKMNIILRKIINTPIPPEIKENEEAFEKAQTNQFQYKLAYGYWWNRSHYLESYRKNFLGGMKDRKMIDKGKENIQRMIANEFTPDQVKQLDESFYNLIEKLSNKKELTAEETADVLDGKGGRKNKF